MLSNCPSQSHDGATGSYHAKYRDQETKALKCDSVIIHIIFELCFFYCDFTNWVHFTAKMRLTLAPECVVCCFLGANKNPLEKIDNVFVSLMYLLSTLEQL